MTEDDGCPRFLPPTFDPTGRYLAFAETVACSHEETMRVVVHDVATGRSWSLGTLDATDIHLSAGPRSVLASVYEGNFFEIPAKLFKIDLQAMRLERIETPSGNLVNGSSQQVVGLGAEAELVITNGQPVMTLTDDGAEVFEPIDSLGAAWQVGDLRGSASGEHVCLMALHTSSPDAEGAFAVLATPDGGAMRAVSDFGFTCDFTSDGYVMFGTMPFEIVGDGLVALPPPSEPLHVGGSFGDVFYATNEQSELVRFDPGTGEVEVVIARGVLEQHCSSEIAPPSTQLYIPPTRAGIGLVRVSCSSVEEYQGGSIAFDLATGGYATIADHRDQNYGLDDLAWSSDGRMLLFGANDEPVPSFYEIGPGPEITVHTMEGVGASYMHLPAAPP